MASLRKIVKAMPSVEVSTPVILARLKKSKVFGKLNPRWSADGILIHDGIPTYKCHRTGVEYTNTNHLCPVLYRSLAPVPFNSALEHFLGASDIRTDKTLAGAWVARSLAERACDGFYLFRFRGPDNHPRSGYFAIAIHRASGMLPLPYCPHFYGGDFHQSPRPLMELTSQMRMDVRGVYHYSDNDIPEHYRIRPITQAPSGQLWGVPQIDVPHANWYCCRNRKDHQRQYGVELEIKCNSRTDRDAVEHHVTKLGWRAHGDGSICSHTGIELNAPPFSYYDTVRDDGPWVKLLEFLRTKAKGWEASQDGTEYGMHVSMNRMAMTPATAAKVYACFNGMQDLCVQVAGRASRWATFPYASQSPESDATRKLMLKHGFDRTHYNKGPAASIRSATRLEVRLFRSCLNRDRFVRNIQLCDSIWSYSEQCSLRDAGNAASYKSWLQDNQYHYPELSAFIANLTPQAFKIASGKIKKIAEAPEVYA